MKEFVVALVLVLVAATAYGEVWGSTRSKIYHYRLCRWNAQIKQEYKISFSSPAVARKAGYEPCGTCRPPSTESRDRYKPAEKERTPP
jgi:methylphosphotriester-DNA--protein-cysteine methyltransferase